DVTPVARVLAGIDLRMSARVGMQTGYISLFESYENYEYAHAVLDAAMRFLREHGVTQVIGPVAPRYDLLNRGLLADGFDGPPVLGNAYNTPALPQMLEKFGFTKWRDYFAYDIDIDKLPAERVLPMANRIRERFGFRVQHIDFSRGNFIRAAQDMASVISEATPDEPGAYMPTPEDILHMLRSIRPYLRDEAAVMAYAGQRPIGCVAGFLDSTPAVRGTDGRRTPLNWLRRYLRIPNIRTSRCPIQYVVPEYQNMAVNTVLLAEAAAGAKRLGIRKVEGSLVDETNILSVNNTKSAGGRLYRTYRVYRMALA
ncbi:MAG TPA: hypothetical protein VLA21_07180, partial [Candidatus Limnocylindria bacterium]|nr:hypothetical protein [Candidatus Limnocylindria bacterium]